jgi:hypothetical protein
MLKVINNVMELNGISRIATAGPVVRNDEAVGSIPTSSTKFWLNVFNSSNRAAFGLYNVCTTEQTPESQHLS